MIIISISKNTKIIHNLKKWILKGERTKEKGSNPHSKGENLFTSQNIL